MPELSDEAYVRKLFAELYGVHLVKIPETTEGKTFDFALLGEGEGQQLIAAVEVKRFERTPRTAENGWCCVEEDIVIDGKIVGKKTETSRGDNAPKRVAAMIHEAYKQLVTAAKPKVLVFVNDENMMDVDDLFEAVNGYLVYGNDARGKYKNTSSMKLAQGRIREEKKTIDLYVWIDRHREYSRTIWIAPHPDGTPRKPEDEPGRGPFLRVASDAGYELARRYFKMPDCARPESDPDADLPTLHEMLLREAGVKRQIKT